MIKEFSLDPLKDTLHLPAADRALRRFAHTTANLFRLDHQSSGGENDAEGRHVVLKKGQEFSLTEREKVGSTLIKKEQEEKKRWKKRAGKGKEKEDVSVMKIPEPDPKWDSETRSFYDIILKFMKDASQLAYTFPETLNASQRKKVHILAEMFEIDHETLKVHDEKKVELKKVDAKVWAHRRKQMVLIDGGIVLLFCYVTLPRCAPLSII
jgi:hypothetical protein